MEKPYMVASDVDGTLLDPWERMSERTSRAVRRVADSEVPFVLVTGRPPRWVPQIVNAMGVAGITVCSNGAVLYDAGDDRVVWSSEMTPALLLDTAHELRRLMPGCAFAVERVGPTAWADLDEQFLAERAFHRAWPNRDISVASVERLAARPAVKLLVLHEQMNSEEMAQVAEPLLGSRFQLTYSTDAGLVELSNAGVDKASGLAAVAADLGVAPGGIIAFGDMPNDIPMLSWVGHGVAMRNAHPGVLEIADEVTAPNAADGVAEVLERWW